ncbi:MAG: polyphosphate kinase 2 family protein [Bacteroidota bacterium]
MKENHKFDPKEFIAKPGKSFSLKDYKTRYKGTSKDRSDAKTTLLDDVTALAKAQDKLYASRSHGVLIILQALDAAGKDGVIRHVMTGINPQGCQVYSFKGPTAEEKLHPFLWRPMLKIPEAGQIAIFNRSYYEEILVVKVHPEFLDGQFFPNGTREKNLDDLWEFRYKEINNFEEWACKNGMTIIKIFLNLSKDEQRKRFLERIDNPAKNWKFSASDLKERQCWKQYQKAFEEMLNETSTKIAPWYVIPADDKKYSRAIVSEIIRSRIEALKLSYPKVSKEAKEALQLAKKQLLDEEKS